jgi:hypothetical protein
MKAFGRILCGAGLAMAAFTSCACDTPETMALESSPWYKEKAKSVEQARWDPLSLLFPRLTDHNQAVWVGTVGEDVQPTGGSQNLVLVNARAVTAQYSDWGNAVHVHCEANDFGSGPLPKKGERWAAHAYANATGFWVLGSGIPIDSLKGGPASRPAVPQTQPTR